MEIAKLLLGGGKQTKLANILLIVPAIALCNNCLKTVLLINFWFAYKELSANF